ncbi:hypothetical protein PHSC3_000405 [Chlamydiales bacterium STE3]|nr:hypothetical protein PHSC3_000405 [Chlamydiales bacterium STE3]
MDITKSQQIPAAICQVQEKLHTAVGRVCEKTAAGRFLGLPLAFTSASLVLAKSCSGVGESFFKGCANAVAGVVEKDPKLKGRRFKKALEQFANGALSIIEIAIFPIVFLVKSITTPIFLLVRGKGYTESEAKGYEQKERDYLLGFTKMNKYIQQQAEEKILLKNIFDLQIKFWKSEIPKSTNQEIPFNDEFKKRWSTDQSPSKALNIALDNIEMLKQLYQEQCTSEQKVPLRKSVKLLKIKQNSIQKNLLQAQIDRRNARSKDPIDLEVLIAMPTRT